MPLNIRYTNQELAVDYVLLIFSLKLIENSYYNL